MKLPKPRTLIILTTLALAVLAPLIIFLCRPPVIIVSDMAFIPLYGKERIRLESSLAALSLFRPVKTVTLADDAGEDTVPYAINEVSKKPYCVLFPLRFVRSARLYREQSPDTPIVILEGRYSEDRSPASSVLGGSEADYFIYKNDIDTDFYAAGLAAVLLNKGIEDNNEEIENGRIVIFLESGIQRQGREAFLRAVNIHEKPPETSFFTSFSQFSANPNLTCVVLAGNGTEFLENNPGVPVIFFTWLDPKLIPNEVVLIFNDSPWAQAVQAVRMARTGLTEGQIQSRIIYRNTQKIDRRALRKIQKKV